MDRWTWMVWNALLPSIAVLVFAFASIWPIAALQDHPMTAGYFLIARWIPLVLFLVGVVMTAMVVWRLRAWERGEGMLCSCGGLLGREREGIRGRGRYRKCLACGSNRNHREYD